MDTSPIEYRRIIEEVTALIGQPEKAALLLKGAPLHFFPSAEGDSGRTYTAWFKYDESLDLRSMQIYLDIGAPAKGPEAYRELLRFNLELFASGMLGTTGLDPDTGHVIFAYRYPVEPSSSGQGLLDSLLRVVNGLDGLPGAVAR